VFWLSFSPVRAPRHLFDFWFPACRASHGAEGLVSGKQTGAAFEITSRKNDGTTSSFHVLAQGTYALTV